MSKESDGLSEYRRKRNFAKTSEPAGSVAKKSHGRYVIQKHDATRLHFDLRLEIDGVFKSWAVPKGPSLNPDNKHLAVEVEDHPLEYGTFEGTVPKKEYGGGTVMLWDRGTFTCDRDPDVELAEGALKVTFTGERMRGKWAIIRMKRKDEDKQTPWLFFKEHDEFESDKAPDLVAKYTTSITTGRTMKQIADQVPPKDMTEKSVPLPREFSPMLATLVADPPNGDDWVHEIKFDGYRILAFLKDGEVRLLSRNGLDWTKNFQSVADSVAKLPAKEALLDGEVVILDERGISDFGALQNYAENKNEKLEYFVFDLPFLDGKDLTRQPLLDRKARLKELLSGQDEVEFSGHIVGHGKQFFKQAAAQGLEGMISKRAESRYAQARTRDWVKVKCIQRQEFVVGGFTEPGGSRTGFGALALGYYDDKRRLIYCGRVGTGFDEKSLANTLKTLQAIEQKPSPFGNALSGIEKKGLHFVKPNLVCEVEFMAWTADGHLRHPVFKGFRVDKDAGEIGVEKPKRENEVGGIIISNPDRVIFPDIGVTKIQLAQYYEDVAPWMLPHLVGRPLAIVRFPQGFGHDGFFQKNFTDTLPDSVHPIDIGDGEGISIDDVQGLVALTQFGGIEIHPWGSLAPDIEKPDRLTFDLDPSDEVTWEDVVRAAYDVRTVLEHLSLKSWVKTSGGKGLHVCVPIHPELEWKAAKEFCHGIAILLEQANPKRYVSNMSLAKRQGRIFVDYLRNGRGATSVAAYSARARATATVSMPIDWDELPGLESAAQFTIENAIERLHTQKRDPWEDFANSPQDLAKVIQLID